MKKLFLIFLILLVPSLASAAGLLSGIVGGTAPATAGTAAYCTAAATCNTPPAQCDLLCEDFDNATSCYAAYDANCWQTYGSLTLNAGDTIDFTTAANGTYICTGTTSTNVFQLVTAGGVNSYVRWAYSGVIAGGWIQLYFNVTAEALDDNDYLYFMTIIDDVADETIYMGLIQTASVLHTRLRYVNTTPAGVNLDGAANLSTGTWYRVVISWTAAGAIAYSLDGVSQGSVADWLTTREPKYFHFGEKGASAHGYTIQFDNIAVDDDTIPSACAL